MWHQTDNRQSPISSRGGSARSGLKWTWSPAKAWQGRDSSYVSDAPMSWRGPATTLVQAREPGTSGGRLRTLVQTVTLPEPLSVKWDGRLPSSMQQWRHRRLFHAANATP